LVRVKWTLVSRSECGDKNVGAIESNECKRVGSVRCV